MRLVSGGSAFDIDLVHLVADEMQERAVVHGTHIFVLFARLHGHVAAAHEQLVHVLPGAHVVLVLRGGLQKVATTGEQQHQGGQAAAGHATADMLEKRVHHCCHV